jgi:hypothetical protein
MAKNSIFETKTNIKPSDEQQSLDVYAGIGNPGQRGLDNQPQTDIKPRVGVVNLPNADGKK